MRYGYVWWRMVMLIERQYAECDKQASKNSLTRPSGLMMQSEKEVYSRE